MNTKLQNRDRTGRYDYSNMDRKCTCGHTLGQHAAAGPHDCFVGDEGNENCSCAKFKPAKKE